MLQASMGDGAPGAKPPSAWSASAPLASQPCAPCGKQLLERSASRSCNCRRLISLAAALVKQVLQVLSTATISATAICKAPKTSLEVPPSQLWQQGGGVLEPCRPGDAGISSGEDGMEMAGFDLTFRTSSSTISAAAAASRSAPAAAASPFDAFCCSASSVALSSLERSTLRSTSQVSLSAFSSASIFSRAASAAQHLAQRCPTLWPVLVP
mmetsp:Transcript_63295/g.112542  ORF Transcript_63295/g.112542 Transcript_63295/m.112542 type:complete len:211 (-) Transcript_63295:196-828(-)